MRYIVRSFIRVLIKIIIIFIKQKNIIILSSFNLMSYRTNTRYLYEYLSKNLHNYNIYYVTESRKIKEYLDKNNLKYISKNNIFKFLYVSASAKIVINSGDAYHNPLNITDTKNIIKICTMHGNSPKTRLPRNIKAKESGYHKFDYICFNNDYTAKAVGIKNFLLDKKKVLALGSPQCDQFYDNKYIQKRMKEKIWSKSMNNNFDQSSKTILYTPTWRPYNYPNPLTELVDFTWFKFDEFLAKNKIFFYYSYHTNKNGYFTENLNSQEIYEGSNIRFIKDGGTSVFLDAEDENKFALYDTNDFMCEVDCLINDYSNTHTDFSLLRKPQIYVMPDYLSYERTQGFLEDYNPFIAGKQVNSFDDLCNSILLAVKNPLYMNEYKTMEDNLIEKYSSHNSNSSNQYLSFLEKI